MLYTTVRFFCSVVAAFARLVRALRKAVAMAASPLPSPVLSAPAAVAPPVGLIAATPLPLRKKALAPPPVTVVAPAEVMCDAGSGVVGVVEQQAESKRKKMEWAARTRPSRLVIPVADDAGEVAAGWGAAAKEADVEVEGEGFWVGEQGWTEACNGGCVLGDHWQKWWRFPAGKAFYGVFDGHGGRAAVDFVPQRLGENVVSAVLAAGAETRGEAASAEEDDAVSAAIRNAYLATDSELLSQHQDASGGACAATALVKGGDLYVAHLGDCRAVLSRDGGAAAALTADHTCAAEAERERIERGGGYVSRSGSGVWRVQGSLAVSRSFGDAGLKRWVLAEPAVIRVPLVAGCEFLVVASDGLWDKVSNQEAVDVVSRSFRNAAPAAPAMSNVGRSCAELVDMARRRGSRDDVTVMVVDLERFVR